MNEYIKKRCEALRRKLNNDGGHRALVIYNDEDSDWENLYYMSGFRGTAGALVVYDDAEPELILDDRYFLMGKSLFPYETVEVTEQKKNALLNTAAGRLAHHGVKNILMSAEHTYHNVWTDMESKCTVNDCCDILYDLRRCKDESEIRNIRTAADIAAKSFTDALNFARPGLKESEFETILNHNIKSNGGDLGFSMIVASGERSAIPHASAGAREFKSGEWVTVDFGARYKHYFCDITRNFFLGTPSDEALEMHDLLLKAHKRAAACVKEGANGTDVHNTAVDTLAEKEMDKYFTHGLGHSFGLEIHEEPRLSRSRTDILKAGDVVTVEPGIYIPGFGGMRLEDDYLVTQDGAVRLTDKLDQVLFAV